MPTLDRCRIKLGQSDYCIKKYLLSRAWRNRSCRLLVHSVRIVHRINVDTQRIAIIFNSRIAVTMNGMDAEPLRMPIE
jgi:hypothetical protein